MSETPPPPEVDRLVIHHALKKCGGNVAAAHRLLKDTCRLTKGSTWLDSTIRKDPALKAVWIDKSAQYSMVEMPNQLTPEQEQALGDEMMRKEQAFIDARNFEDVFGSDAQEATMLARFAEESFSKSVNLIHGIVTKSSLSLAKRAEWIVEEVLLNEEEVQRKEVSDGELVEFEGPKYTEAEKLEWQKEYTNIISELRKFGDSFNAAGLARLKAKELAMKMDAAGGGNGKSKRGGRAYK